MTEHGWSIGVKRLGGEDDFTIQVSPDDDISVLQEQITEKTGLCADQQRLIYRGRLINGKSQHPQSTSTTTLPANAHSKNEAKVRDIIGLEDGQTIHLVPKPNNEASAGGNDAINTNSDSSDDTSSPSTRGLLAALLGISSDPDETDEEGNALSQQLQRLRSARVARNRARRPSYRLSESDLEVSDPGSLEAVRQGMLTMNTLMSSQVGNEDQPDWMRRWYRGQWIDCRDTVNQWLEATVVEIVRPDDVLPRHLLNHPRTRRRRVVVPTTDAAVSATDFEGRMRLLLEPCDDYEFEGEWGGYRQRDNNDGVQLLLVHFNGWGHRWDEWIRSDSERIRPFRTRTRHQGQSALPTPQSTFNEAPATHIKSPTDDVERSAFLPELHMVLVGASQTIGRAIPTQPVEPANSLADDLPWAKRDDETDSNETNLDDVLVRQNGLEYNRKDLEELAPLMDRLGRLLQDAAPHVASLASSLPKTTEATEPERTPVGESNVVVVDDMGSDETAEPTVATSIGAGVFALPGSESSNVVFPTESSRQSEENMESIVEEMNTVQDPDYADFGAGSVNTSRSLGRSPRSDDGASLLGAALAAASLSSLTNDNDGTGGSGFQALRRALGQREQTGNNGIGGGIDIHIHAIVTGPGVAGGVGGMALLGDPQISSRSTENSATTELATVEEDVPPVQENVDPDDAGIFSDLYSEDPDAIDLHGAAEEFPSSALPAELSPVAGGGERDEGTDADKGEEATLPVAQPVTPARSPARVRQTPSTPNSEGRNARRGGFARLFRRRRSGN